MSSFCLLCWRPFMGKYPNLIIPILKTPVYFSQDARISFQEYNFVIIRLKHDTESDTHLYFLPVSLTSLKSLSTISHKLVTFYTVSLCHYLIHLQKYTYGEFCCLLTINASQGLFFLLLKGKYQSSVNV